MKNFLILFTICVFAVDAGQLHAGDTGAQPNILILYADDLGYGDLSIQNSESKIPTPHLDELARQSMRFTDGHSSSGICYPSRYALLTGRYHWRKFLNVLGRSAFDKERLTLPDMLHKQGYHTAAIGKWHLGWNWGAILKPDAKQIKLGKVMSLGPEAYDWSKPIPDGPLAHGFDHYFGDNLINFPPYCWIEDDHVVVAPDVMMDTTKWKPIKEGNWECIRGPMVSTWDPYQNIPTITKHGVKYIHEQAKTKNPFFLYFAFPSPHAPIIPNDKFDGKSQAGPYGDFVYETDDAAGQLLRALEESGQSKNTIVIFSSDNGPERYAYERDRKFDHWSSNPFRGLKRDIYEGGHHVPFMIRWPGVTRPGVVSNALVSQIDLMATIAAIVNFKLPKGQAEDSHNLLPLIRGEVNFVRTTHIHNMFRTAHIHNMYSKYAIRHRHWLLIDWKTGYSSIFNVSWEKKHNYPKDDNYEVELYNLANDNGQRHNVAANHPERVRELQAMLKEIREVGFSAPNYKHR